MLLGRCEDVQCRNVGGISSSLGIELFPKPANELRLAVHNREHPAQEEKVAQLYRLYVSAKRRWSRWELNAKVFQTLLSTGWPKVFGDYHCQMGRLWSLYPATSFLFVSSEEYPATQPDAGRRADQTNPVWWRVS